MTGKITVRLSSRGPRRGRPGLAVAHRLRREGHFSEADKIFRAHLAANETDRDAWLGLARSNESRGRFAQAAYCLWRASRIDPADFSLHEDLGQMLLCAGDRDRAAIVLADLIARRPDNLKARISLSAIQRAQGKIAQSRQTLEAGVRRNPITVIHGFARTPLRVLRLHGVHNAYYALSKTDAGKPSTVLHSGNFSTAQLLNDRRFTIIDFRVLGTNLSEAQSLPLFDITVNTIADPDVEAASLLDVARFSERDPSMPIINDPRRVLETSRDANFSHLAGMPGVRFPMTVRLKIESGGRPDLAAFLDRHGLRFPVILREPGTHTGRTTIKADTLESALAYLDRLGSGEVYVIEFIDCRYRAELFRKMRVFFIDGRIYPVVHHIDQVWNVHGRNRGTVMARNEWMMDIERAFLEDPERHIGAGAYERLMSLHDLVRLDFFGVDFTLTDAGELLIYEMNPAMRHSFDHARLFPYLRPYLQRITAAFRDMVVRRAGGEAASPHL